MTKDEIDAVAEAILTKMEARYVTHDQLKDKFERCFAFDCMNSKARDKKHAENKFLERLHDGTQAASNKLLMVVLTAFGIGVLTALFGPGWIEKLRG